MWPENHNQQHGTMRIRNHLLLSVPLYINSLGVWLADLFNNRRFSKIQDMCKCFDFDFDSNSYQVTGELKGGQWLNIHFKIVQQCWKLHASRTIIYSKYMWSFAFSGMAIYSQLSKIKGAPANGLEYHDDPNLCQIDKFMIFLCPLLNLVD